MPTVNFAVQRSRLVSWPLMECPMHVDALLPEFDHEMTVTRKLLERVPDDRLDGSRTRSRCRSASSLSTSPPFRAGAASRSARANSIWARNRPPIPLARRADLLTTFDRLVGDTRAALVGKTDAELMAPWALKKDGHAIFSMPKAAVWRSFVISHIVHHRGQLSVYLRLNDVPVPSIYGPSADEGQM